MTIFQVKSGPTRRDAWLKAQCLTAQSETQNRFNGYAVEPTRRARVPRPSAAARVWRGAVHVSTSNIRFNFVTLNLLRSRGMVDRVDEVPKFEGAIAGTLQRRRQRNPNGCVGVLA